MTLNYKQFILEQLLMESIREMKFVLSDRFIEVLKKINSEISDELLRAHTDLDFKTKQTFIDINPDSDQSITFILANKAADMLNIETEDQLTPKQNKNLRDNIPPKSDIYTKQRGSMRIGSFINTVFPGKFPSSERVELGQKTKDVENFVKVYKSLNNQDEKFKQFDVVSGEDISYWYNYENYSSRQGTMGDSCMSDVPSSYLEIYTDNPQSVKLVILYSNTAKSKIKGRALLWKLISPDDTFYMDRIYTNNSSDVDLFVQFAKKNKWYVKGHQSYGADSNIVDASTGEGVKIKLKSKLHETDYDKYPYMDTMCYYNPDNGILGNKRIGAKYYLTSTGGWKEELSGDYAVVFSKYHNEEILERDSQWCQIGEDFVNKDEALRVYNTGLGERVYAVPGHPDVVHCYIKNGTNKPIANKYFPKEKCVWSSYLNTWVFYDSVRTVYLDVNKQNSEIDHKKREGIFFAQVGEDCYDISLVEKDGDTWKLKGEPVVTSTPPKPKRKKKKIE